MLAAGAPDASGVGVLARINDVEAVLVVPIVFVAAMMARGLERGASSPTEGACVPMTAPGPRRRGSARRDERRRAGGGRGGPRGVEWGFVRALGLSTAAMFTWNVRAGWFLGDDAFLSFRYARHLAEG